MAEEGVVLSNKGRKMGQIGIINPKKLIDLKFTEGWSNNEIAEYFGVSYSAVHQALRRIRKESLGELYDSGKELAKQNLSVQALIVGLMSDAADILKTIKAVTDNSPENIWDKMDIEKRKLQIATMAEIRAQIAMYQSISEKLYSFEAHEEFQKMVVDTIQEEAPEVAEKIRKRLQRSQPLRSFIGGSRRAG